MHVEKFFTFTSFVIVAVDVHTITKEHRMYVQSSYSKKVSSKIVNVNGTRCTRSDQEYVHHFNIAVAASI
jgi:hypothetical protein